jgi:hypothetical protein
MKYRLVFFVLLITFSSCRTVQKNNGNSLNQKFPQWKNEIKTINYSANLTASFPDVNQVVATKIKVSGVDSISLSLIGPLGINLGKLFSKPDYFIFYNTFENNVFEGNPNAENLKRVMNIPLSFFDFSRLIRCETPGNPADFKMDKSDADNSRLIFKNTSNSSYIEYAVISSIDYTLIQYQRKLSDGSLILNTYYSDFENHDGVYLPNKVVFDFPDLKGNLKIDFDKIDINSNTNGSYSFEVPKGIRRFKL